MPVEDAQFPYQNPGLAVEQRVDDLMSRMTIEDKAALLFHPIGMVGPFDTRNPYNMPPMEALLGRGITHFNILQAKDIRELVEWINAVQRYAFEQPLGIPVTISSDPRHAFVDNPKTSMFAGPFSQWPEPLGFGALADEGLVARWGEVVRTEYLAAGIRVALHPQIDLATEPRWARQSGTFGQDADVSGRLGAAYIRALQGSGIGPESVAAMAKHFPGGGPQKDGEDPHFAHGREQVYPGGMFDLHVEPFKAAIDAGVAQIMPYYGLPIETEYEEVGFGFSKQIVTDLLRDKLGFDGIVCTDWAILSRSFWGVEELSFEERMIKALDAGIDQFGGDFRPDVLAKIVRNGRVSESRLDASARRLLRQKFALGLFENRFADLDTALKVIGAPAAREEGIAAQAASLTLLQNVPGAAHLPLAADVKVYAENFDLAALESRARSAGSVREADVAILRIAAPFEQRSGDEEAFHSGSLEFGEETLERIQAIASAVPTVVDIYLDRPAIVAPLLEMGVSLVANYGASAEAVARVLFGEAKPLGRLPFQIPSSMEVVAAGRSDVPSDDPNPTLDYGFGLSCAED